MNLVNYDFFNKSGGMGDFPRGHLNADDEGGLRIAIALDEDSRTIIIDFGKAVKWIGFDAFTAKKLGENLIEKANAIIGKINVG